MIVIVIVVVLIIQLIIAIIIIIITVVVVVILIILLITSLPANKTESKIGKGPPASDRPSDTLTRAMIENDELMYTS